MTREGSWKALSLWQPWASAIAHGLKRVETRRWPAWHWSNLNRPPFGLMIHAAKRNEAGLFLEGSTPEEAALRAEELIELERRAGCPWNELPSGCFVAVCRLTDCRKTARNLSDMAEWVEGLSGRERLWGGFSLDRWGWFLDDVSRIATPIPARGRQGMWEVRLEQEVELVGAPAETGVPHVPARDADGSLFGAGGPAPDRPVLPPAQRGPGPRGPGQGGRLLPGFEADLPGVRLQGHPPDRHGDGARSLRRHGGRS